MYKIGADVLLESWIVLNVFLHIDYHLVFPFGSISSE